MTITDGKIVINGTNSVITLDPAVGIQLQKKSGTVLTNMFYVDTNGNAIFSGQVLGGTLNIGDGAFKVNQYGELDIGDGAFWVDRYGNCSANSITLKNPSITGTLDLGDPLVVKNLVVGENVTMGPNASISWANVTNTSNVALKSDLGDYLDENDLVDELKDYFGITSTRIGQSKIESPEIVGATITGGILNQESSRSTWADIQISGGEISFFKSSNNYGYLLGDVGSQNMCMHGYRALKLTSDLGISISAGSSSWVYLSDTAMVSGSEFKLSGTSRLVDDKGNTLISGSTGIAGIMASEGDMPVATTLSDWGELQESVNTARTKKNLKRYEFTKTNRDRPSKGKMLNEIIKAIIEMIVEE